MSVYPKLHPPKDSLGLVPLNDLGKGTYKGEQGWISGSYGSCSGCDAFEAEFGWSVRDQPDYQCKLKSFGEGYLGGIYSTEQQVQSMLGLYMSDEDKEAVVWVREIAERYGVK